MLNFNSDLLYPANTGFMIYCLSFVVLHVLEWAPAISYTNEILKHSVLCDMKGSIIYIPKHEVYLYFLIVNLRKFIITVFS